ncbi:hypothetical protein F2Q69_00053127 [Brassica cretica]|uniref:Uncharacterized protein n=1 Tax=Brassica cretica TaxID=69181 RepID=A0A8S9N380_BRACR|nr:hypothetical protein F2Q69_00053127 [Brassica cretica]
MQFLLRKHLSSRLHRLEDNIRVPGSIVKLGASSLSLGQLTGADGQAHSARERWGPAHLSLAECSGPDQCGRGRAVTRLCRRLLGCAGGSCGTMGPCASRFESGLGQRPRR